MRLSYPRYRKLPGALNGSIATCNACVFWRSYIRLCPAPQLEPAIQDLLQIQATFRQSEDCEQRS